MCDLAHVQVDVNAHFAHARRHFFAWRDPGRVITVSSVWDYENQPYFGTCHFRCARKEQWSETQTWFDYWELYETPDTSFFGLLARANKLECMLHSLSKSMEIGNMNVAEQLQKSIQAVSMKFNLTFYPADQNIYLCKQCWTLRIIKWHPFCNNWYVKNQR